MKSISAIALALYALVALPIIASAQSTPVNGPTTYNFTAASQSNVWTCSKGQSSFSLIVPSGLTGTFTVTVSQTQSGTYVNPPWSYAPGVATYTNTITNSGSLTVNLGSNGYVKVADTAYTSGSATVTGTCSGAVAVIPPQIASVNAGANIVVSAGPTPTVSTTMAPTFTAAITGNAAATPSPVPVGYNGPAVIAQATAAPTAQPGNTSITGTAYSAGVNLSGLSVSSSVCTDSSKNLSSCTKHVKLAIGLGFASGTVSTSTTYPYQAVVALTNGQITGIRAACGAVDNGTTVFTLYKNGTSIGTLTLSTSQASSVTITTVTIAAGDILHGAITTAGTGANCGFIAEGQQDAF